MPNALIFSDLDGTLLDATDYSFTPALPALQWIRARGVALVLCSSKTRAEIERCRLRLSNPHPFIAENGGGIFIPRTYFTQPIPGSEVSEGYLLIRLGLPYAQIRQRFVALRERLGARVRGFGDMGADEVAELTGLGREEAALAKRRDFEEPFVFDGPPDSGFLRAIKADGLRWTQGRLFHMLGDHDKGRAVATLLALYRRANGDCCSIGLGNSFNDLPLLQAVDLPVLVRNEDGDFDARLDLPGLLKTQHPGPRGWNDAVLHLLAQPAPAG